MWSEISAPEAFAQACGVLQAVLAALIWRHRALRRGWGLGWLSLSLGAAAAVNMAAPWMVTPLLTQDTAIRSSPALAMVVMLIGFSSLAALVAGLRAYCQRSGWRPARVFLTLWLVLPASVVGLALADVPKVADWTAMLLFGYCAVLCWKTGQRERGVGHFLLAGVLFLYPVMVLAMGLTSLEVATVRYLAAAPFTVIGVVLLSVTLNRLRLEREHAQRELRELNADLEQRVLERTHEIARRNAELAHSLEQLEKVRQELLLSEQRLQQVMAASGEGIWDWNVQSGTLYSSPRWCEMLGLEPIELQRNVAIFAELLLDDERAAVQSAVDSCLGGNGPFRLEHQMRRSDGSVLWVSDRGDLVERDSAGKPLRMVGSVADITARKQAEHALVEAKQQSDSANRDLQSTLRDLHLAKDRLVQSEKLAALGGLVAGVAHELNTPLGNALTTVSALLDSTRVLAGAQASGTLRRSQLESFLSDGVAAGDLVMRNVQRAAHLVESFKQVAVDQSSLQRRVFELHRVVGDTVTMLSPSFKHKPVVLEQDIPESLRLDSFPGQLEQVLTNLLQNAVIHGLGERTVLHVRIHAKVSEQGGRAGVELVCEDDGDGMTQEVVKLAFDPYFTTRFGQGGSGLGLYIVYNLVNSALGGSITLHSAPGQGTRTTLWLPLAAPD